MIQFIKSNKELFSVARTAEDAFYMWKTAQKLNHTVKINSIDYGNDWEARHAIEQYFNVSYSLPINVK